MTAIDPKQRTPGQAAFMRQVPNGITIFRFLLVIPAGWLLWQDAVVEALVVIAVAGLSDAVDGALARRFDWRTEFGAVADPAADKLLIMVVFAVLTLRGHIPIWLVTVVVGRDVVIVSGALTYRLLFGELEMAPTLLSKINTGAQIVLLLLTLLHLTGAEPAATWAGLVNPAGFVLVGVLSVLSGAHYVAVWSRRAQLESRRRKAAQADRT